MKHYLYILLFLLATVTYGKSTKNVLILHSYHESSSWVTNIQKGINDTIDKENFNINIFIENMDTKRFHSKEYYSNLVSTYKLKYKNIKFDVIISSDNNAFNFLKKHRNDIFGEIPVSFCGVNFFKQSDLDGHSYYTGVAENINFIKNIELIKKLHPGVKKIFITADQLHTSEKVKAEIKSIIEKNDFGLEFEFSKNQTFSELKNDVKNLTSDTVTIIGIYFKDKSGKYYDPSVTAKEVVEVSSVPVYTLFDFFLVDGIFGGNMVSSYMQGKMATEIANKILYGTEVSSIRVVEDGATQNIFDNIAMAKFNIHKDDLPKDSVIKNKNIYLFTKDELDFILKNPKIIVGGEMDWMPFDFVNKYGDYDGITADILNIISQKSGLNFTIKTNFSWEELLNQFKDGKIDILPAIYYSESRSELGSFTNPYIKIQEDFFVLESSNFKSVSDLNNATFAGIEGYLNIEKIKAKLPNIKIVMVKNLEHAIKLLLDKKVDVFIAGQIVVEYILKEKGIKNIRNIQQNLIEAEDLRMLVQKGNKELYQIISKSLSSITEEELIELKKKWSDKKLFLTENEKKWIKEHQTLKVAIDPDFLPFTGLEIKNNKLEAKGISVDLLEAALTKIGIKPEFIKTSSWSDSLEAVKNGRADLLTTTAITEERKKYLKFTDKTIQAPRAIAVNEIQKNITSLNDLKDLKVGLIKDGAIAKRVLDSVNIDNVIWYTNINEGLKDLASKKIDAFVDSFYVMGYIISNEGLTSLNLVNKFDIDNELQIAVNKQNISNVGIDVINKALTSITKAEKSDIKKKWMSINIVEEVDYTILFEIIALFLFFLAGTLYWARKLNIAKKETEIAKLEIEELHERTQESIEYALLLQKSIIPKDEVLKKHFKNFFVIWEPKDIVGGDIYLFEDLREGDECLLMVIDCTGHGVSGAFVTMLVKAIERQIIAKIEYNPNFEISPSWILEYFNKTIKTLLNQTTKDSLSNAGFDGQVVYYNKKQNIIKCASARNPIFYIQNDELKEIKPDRHSVGYRDSNADYKFKDQIINVDTNTKLYISSDGYWDQVGENSDFSFGKKRLKKLIDLISNDDYNVQKESLQKELKSYQGNFERLDDVTFIGLEIEKQNS